MGKQSTNKHSVSLLSEQKIREFVAKYEQSEHKPNTKKLC